MYPVGFVEGEIAAMNEVNGIVAGIHKPQTRRQPIVTTFALCELCVDNALGTSLCCPLGVY